jgi:RNA polymerase sigma-70 factor (ECF subfamily)
VKKTKKCILTIGGKSGASDCNTGCYAYRPGSGCVYLKTFKFFFDSSKISGSQLAEQKDIEEIIIESYHKLKSYCMQLTQNFHLSEDICQEVLKRALENKDKFKPDQPVLPWLLKTARNLIIDLYRKEKTQTTELIGEFRDFPHSLSGDVEQFPLDALGLLALGSLTEHQRKAIELIYVEDLEIDEAARRMGLSYKGFYSLLNRALKKLREELKDFI